MSEIDQPLAVLVEGRDDVGVTVSLLNAHGLAGDYCVYAYNGGSNLQSYLSGFVKASGFSSVTGLAIIRDADDDAAAAFQSVQGALKHVGLAVPTVPLTLINGVPNIAVLIQPGDGQPGMLEDILLRSLEDEPALNCVDGFLQCLNNHNLPAPTNMSKARVHTYLSSRPEPGLKLGEAARSGFFQLTHTAFDQTVALLRLIKT